MAEINLPMENRLVKESNACARSRMTGNTRNANVLLKALIAQVRTDEPNLEKTYSVEIAPFFNCTTHNLNTKQIKDAIDNLLSIKIFIETKRNKQYLLKGMVLIPDAEYSNGIISARFNPSIKEHLIQLKGTFTEFDALEYSALPSAYSQKLYEILKSYEKGLNRERIEFDLEELKKLLDCPKSMNEYQNFKRLVLQKAYNDINNKTSLKFEWEPLKTGKKVSSICFRIIKDKPAPKRKTSKNDLALLAAAAAAPAPEPLQEQDKAKIKNNAQAIRDMLRGKLGPEPAPGSKRAGGGGLVSAGAILSGWTQ